MTPAIPDHPDRPDRPACASQRAYPHLSLLRTAVVLAALLFRPSNSAVKERVKKGELFFVHMILFYWPATLTMVCRRRGGARRGHEDGPAVAAAAGASENR